MADFAGALGASKAASTLLVLFIPSRDRNDRAIDQVYWVDEALSVLGTLFGGATAFPQGRGVWRDDAQGGRLLFDEPVVIQCYTSKRSSGKRRSCGSSSTVWAARRSRELSGWSSIMTTWRSASHRGKKRRRGGKKAGREGVSDMAKNIKRITDELGARVVSKVPHTGGGAFGAARLAHIVAAIQARLEPGQGLRPGRPTDASWVRHPKVPMSDATRQRLARLAEESSTGGRKVSPMQIAAQILEDALAGVPEQ